MNRPQELVRRLRPLNGLPAPLAGVPVRPRNACQLVCRPTLPASRCEVLWGIQVETQKGSFVNRKDHSGVDARGVQGRQAQPGRCRDLTGREASKIGVFYSFHVPEPDRARSSQEPERPLRARGRIGPPLNRFAAGLTARPARRTIAPPRPCGPFPVEREHGDRERHTA